MRRFKKKQKPKTKPITINTATGHIPEKLENAIIYADPCLEETEIEEIGEEEPINEALLLEQGMLVDNPYDLININTTLDNLNGPYCPLIYVNSEMYQWPSPYDIVLERTHDAIMEADANGELEFDKYDGMKLHYKRNLREQALKELSDSCFSAIEGVYSSFIEENVRDKFNYQRNGIPYKYDVDLAIADLCNISNYINPYPMFMHWWDIMDNPNLNPEEKNHANTQYLLMFRDNIMTLLAGKFTTFARETAFCEYAGHQFYITDINERDDFLRALSEEYQENVTPEVFYSWEMGEYTCMVDTLTSMIEVILYQAVNNFNFMYFPTNEDAFNDILFSE